MTRISNLVLTNYDFGEYVKFGAVLLKINILLITALLKFESGNPFAHVCHVSL